MDYKQLRRVVQILVIVTCLLPVTKVSCQPAQSPNKAIATISDTSIVYRSPELIVKQVAPHVYQHTSFLKTNDFGLVPCNGMLILSNKEVVIFDTPADSTSSEALISFVKEKLKGKINAVIATHFHADCVGGMEAFSRHHLSMYATHETIALLKAKSNANYKRLTAFNQRLSITTGGQNVYAEFVGQGHTRDNIIGYFPAEKVLFGGCLIKEVGATKGNLEDANTAAWPTTVLKLKSKYPDAITIIPGHGKTGGRELLDYTINLFKSN